MFDRPMADRDPELRNSLAELQCCSTKLAGALTAVNSYIRTVPVGATNPDDLVAMCDTVKQYLEDFWSAYNETVQLLDRPSDVEVLAVLNAIERNWGGPYPKWAKQS